MEKAFNPEEIKKSEEERIKNLRPEYDAQTKKQLARAKEMLDKLDANDLDLLNDLVTEERDKAAFTDELTGIYNRKALEQMVPDIMNAERRYDRNYSLLLIDIDRFKKFNDTLGHLAGDEILKKLPKIIKREIRESDLLFRWGGEELCVFLQNTHTVGAMKIAEKIRKAVEKEVFILQSVSEDKKNQKVTLSIGVFSSEQLTDEDKEKKSKEILKKFIGQADKALYKAKEGGRNQSVLFHESMEEKNNK